MASPVGDASFIGETGVTGVAVRDGTLGGLANGPATFAPRMGEPVMVQLDPAGPPPDAAGTTGYAPVYYPGTTSSAGAATIALGLSEERAGLDLQLPLVAMGTVSGTVMSSDGRPPAGTEVRLVALEQALPGLGTKVTVAGAEGRFSFTGVVPGRYRVTARAGSRQEVFVDDTNGQTRVMMTFSNSLVRSEGPAAMNGLPTPPPPSPPRWAAAEVNVSGGATEAVSLVLAPGVTVSGRVAFDADVDPPADLAAIRIVLNTASAAEGTASASGLVGRDGRFTIEGVVPGRYRVSVLAPGGLRARAFDVAGEDALDFLLAVDDRPIADATLTLTSHAATVAGSLQQASGQPAADCTIVLFADDPRYWTPRSRRVQATRPATDGRFSFRNLPGGAYRLVAVEDLEDGQWFDPAVLRQLAGAALAITVGDAETKTQDIRVAPRK
jgi:hypothetical protein